MAPGTPGVGLRRRLLNWLSRDETGRLVGKFVVGSPEGLRTLLKPLIKDDTGTFVGKLLISDRIDEIGTLVGRFKPEVRSLIREDTPFGSPEVAPARIDEIALGNSVVIGRFVGRTVVMGRLLGTLKPEVKSFRSEETPLGSPDVTPPRMDDIAFGKSVVMGKFVGSTPPTSLIKDEICPGSCEVISPSNGGSRGPPPTR